MPSPAIAAAGCHNALALVHQDDTMMHLLINQYVPADTDLHRLVQRDCYDLLSLNSKDVLKQIFYKKIFHEEAFFMNNGKWHPNLEHCIKWVEDVLGSEG